MTTMSDYLPPILLGIAGITATILKQDVSASVFIVGAILDLEIVRLRKAK